MATQREEIAIKLGVDSRQAVTVLESLQMKIANFSDSAIKKLGSIFKANVFAAATDLALAILPTWDEIWSRVYGTDPASMAKSEEANQNLRSWAQRVRDARRSLEDTIAKSEFDSANNLDKEGILESSLGLKERDLNKARERLALVKATKSSIEDLAAAQLKVNTTLEEYVKLQDQLTAVRKGFSDAEQQTSSERHEKEFRASVFRRRTDMKSLQAEIDFNNEEGNFDEAKRLTAQRNALAGSIREDVFQRTRNAVGSLPDVNFGGGNLFGPLKGAFNAMNTFGGLQTQQQKMITDAQTEALQNVFKMMNVPVVIQSVNLK